MLVSRELDSASTLVTDPILGSGWSRFSSVSLEALGSIFGAPGIGVEVTAFGPLFVVLGVPEVLGFGALGFGVANAARAPGDSHRELGLLELLGRSLSFLTSCFPGVPGLGDLGGFSFWGSLVAFGTVFVFDLSCFGGCTFWAPVSDA